MIEISMRSSRNEWLLGPMLATDVTTLQHRQKLIGWDRVGI